MFAPALNHREARLEWPLWTAVLGLMLLGAAFIFSATGDADAAANLPWWRYRAVGHVLASVLGLGVVSALCLVGYGRLARWSLVAYWASIALLVGVFLVGVSRNGAKRWIDLGPVQFQPSEFAKLAFLFALANFLSRPPEELRLPGNFLKALGLALLPFGLILKEPDLGSALVFMPTALAMMFVAGVPRAMKFDPQRGTVPIGVKPEVTFECGSSDVPREVHERCEGTGAAEWPQVFVAQRCGRVRSTRSGFGWPQ